MSFAQFMSLETSAVATFTLAILNMLPYFKRIAHVCYSFHNIGHFLLMVFSLCIIHVFACSTLKMNWTFTGKILQIIYNNKL
jgi:TctA family transporter